MRNADTLGINLFDKTMVIMSLLCAGGAWRNTFNVCGRRASKLMAENGVDCDRFGPPACRQLV